MKKILMFSMASCPHCQKAHRMMDELKEKHPEFRDIALEVIDETEQPELANEYDYWFVPTYYVDGKKLHEGVPTAAAIANVFAAAAKE